MSECRQNIVIDEYTPTRYFAGVELIRIYQCFCDATRLRILHLLRRGPLCVCHFQEVLDLPQVKVSQHLAYLRKRGMVEARRHGQWMIYSLPSRPSPGLEANLKCLQDCALSDKRFRADLRRLEKVKSGRAWLDEVLKDHPCCNH